MAWSWTAVRLSVLTRSSRLGLPSSALHLQNQISTREQNDAKVGDHNVTAFKIRAFSSLGGHRFPPRVIRRMGVYVPVEGYI
ncbi:hypothetical protein BKA63DRAFT_504292 [Paraphoma chrysanthemicola]|nr:hypothetical protein BKA63DRAFT_504292 [Paraphoma chrysanthemicola]